MVEFAPNPITLHRTELFPELAFFSSATLVLHDCGICSVVQVTSAIQTSSCILQMLDQEVGSRWKSSKVVLQQDQAGSLQEELVQVCSNRGGASAAHPHGPAGLILTLSLGSPLSCQRTNFPRHLQIYPCYQASCSADQRADTFDPEAGVACTTMAHSACSNLDINLVCNPTKLTCDCRRNMAWNPVARECQVFETPNIFHPNMVTLFPASSNLFLSHLHYGPGSFLFHLYLCTCSTSLIES